MADFESGTATMSTPETPGMPKTLTSLMSSVRVDSLSYDRKSMLRCKCLPLALDVSPWAVASHTCFTHFSAPDISLTRKCHQQDKFLGNGLKQFEDSSYCGRCNQKWP
ncbi:Aquaporin NIP3-1 [Forsythia ovata]|uniref:Aquaporin NIP3-1 n=1 Tax=Forsythia ovata TaxID=205694 RepID=A0ABD1TT33_9LAMI